MNELILAVLVLTLGAGACLLQTSNTVRAGCGLVSQAIATALAWSAVILVLSGGPDITGGLSWAYPIGAIHFRLDALGAFFLELVVADDAARQYLRRRLLLQKYFAGPRHLGVHFALLNMIALSFLLVLHGRRGRHLPVWLGTAALAAWQLVIWDYTNQKVRFAGFNYPVSTHVGLIFPWSPP